MKSKGESLVPLDPSGPLWAPLDPLDIWTPLDTSEPL